MSDKVLDTLKFKDSKIFLKKFHVQRSYEACALVDPQTQLVEIKQIYDQLESQYSAELTQTNILRIEFNPLDLLNFEVSVIEKSKLPEILTLELMRTALQTPGLGSQNYKWSQREQWDHILKSKNPKADDVICVNLKNEVTETVRCNLFFYDTNRDLVLTPPLHAGCINGVYRRYVIESGSIMLPELGSKKIRVENILSYEIIKYQIFAANSVREVMKANLLHDKLEC